MVNILQNFIYKNINISFYLAAKLRLSILTTASAAVIYHKCSCYLEKTDFDQYVSLKSLFVSKINL